MHVCIYVFMYVHACVHVYCFKNVYNDVLDVRASVYVYAHIVFRTLRRLQTL